MIFNTHFDILNSITSTNITLSAIVSNITTILEALAEKTITTTKNVIEKSGGVKISRKFITFPEFSFLGGVVVQSSSSDGLSPNSDYLNDNFATYIDSILKVTNASNAMPLIAVGGKSLFKIAEDTASIESAQSISYTDIFSKFIVDCKHDFATTFSAYTAIPVSGQIISISTLKNIVYFLIGILQKLYIFKYKIIFKQFYSYICYDRETEILFALYNGHKEFKSNAYNAIFGFTPIARYTLSFKSTNNLLDNVDNFNISDSNSFSSIALFLTNVNLIYNTDTILSDEPTFDITSNNGSNGEFKAYRIIEYSKYNIFDSLLADINVFFDLTKNAQGKVITYQHVLLIINYIFLIWLKNIHVFNYTIYACHVNCHYNKELSSASETTIIIYQIVPTTKTPPDETGFDVVAASRIEISNVKIGSYFKKIIFKKIKVAKTETLYLYYRTTNEEGEETSGYTLMFSDTSAGAGDADISITPDYMAYKHFYYEKRMKPASCKINLKYSTTYLAAPTTKSFSVTIYPYRSLNLGSNLPTTGSNAYYGAEIKSKYDGKRKITGYSFSDGGSLINTAVSIPWSAEGADNDVQELFTETKDDSMKVKTSINIYIVTKDIQKDITIQYDLDGGSASPALANETFKSTAGSSIKLIDYVPDSTVVKAGNIFDYWSYSSNKIAKTTKYTVTTDDSLTITIKATYKTSHTMTITYDLDGGTDNIGGETSTITFGVADGDKIKIADYKPSYSITKESTESYSYTFQKWQYKYTGSSYSNITGTTSVTVTNRNYSISIKAIFKLTAISS